MTDEIKTTFIMTEEQTDAGTRERIEAMGCLVEIIAAPTVTDDRPVDEQLLDVMPALTIGEEE